MLDKVCAYACNYAHDGVVIINEPSWIMTKFMFTKSQVHRVVKRMSKDYQRAYQKALEDLEDLDKADVLEPNNASTLNNRGVVKIILKEYQGALEDFEKADVLEPNNAFTLKSRGVVKKMLKEYQEALEDLTRLMFSNQTMHSP
ncbi:unnamed protein product [Sphagnum jensenii]|uniref:Uncharacterized protein n=1 Tax=Sphagnum jensenii TaxID=128206 RepID=A0ABP1AD00_9BRYO